jgi:hypothetical protein
LNTFGLKEIWPIILNANANIAGLFTTSLVQLLIATPEAQNQARPILSQLAVDLVNISNNNNTAIVSVITQSLDKLNQVLVNVGY